MPRIFGVLIPVVFVQLGCSIENQVTVPDLHQKPVTQAYAELRALGLEVEIDGAFFLAPHHTSWVDGHAPEAGNKLDVGSLVTIHPGFALTGSLAVRKDQIDPIVVPPVLGESLENAARMLEDAGLFWDAIEIGPLERTDAPTLYSNYEVTRSSVEPGRGYDQVNRGVRLLRLWVKKAE